MTFDVVGAATAYSFLDHTRPKVLRPGLRNSRE